MQNGERGFGQIKNASGARRNAHFIISKSIIKDRTEKGTARGGGGGTETHRGGETHRGTDVGIGRDSETQEGGGTETHKCDR